MKRLKTLLTLSSVALALFGGGLRLHGQQPASAPAPRPQQPSEVQLVITGDPGTPPRYAVPEFVALTPDAAAIAKTISQVLWDDLAFEREFYLLPRDTYAGVPAARSPEQVPFAAWRELGADAVVFGTVQKTGNDVRVSIRLLNVRTRESVFAKDYSPASGNATNPRVFAHTFSDEIHLQQRALRGVARTKLAFVSDRQRGRLTGTVQNRDAKEVYVSDYDGANPRPITISRDLNLGPAWSPDGRALAYTSYRRGLPDIFISHIYQGTPPETPLKGVGSNYLPAWSPDGTRLAFMSARDGNPEIYVCNRDGSNLRRLTNHPGGDGAPTWSPSGTQIAFISDRLGQPQLFVVGADGTNLRSLPTAESYVDRPTWSPAPFNEIAFAAQRGGGGFDIKVYDLASGQKRSLTDGQGTNESPAFSPNGRHLAFVSDRTGSKQIFTMTRDGRDVKQLTREGSNLYPAWSN